MYFSVKNRTDKEVGNVFPQLDCLTQLHAHQLKVKEFPSFEPKLTFELERKAKLTDVLSEASIVANGLIINEKVKSILENYQLMPHKFYPATIKTKKGDLTYYWLHLSEYNLLNRINYPDSKFFRTEYGFRKEDITLASFEDYKAKKVEFGNMGTVKSEFLSLDKQLEKTHHLICLPLFDHTVYINEKIYNELVDQKVTGIEYEEATAISLQ